MRFSPFFKRFSRGSVVLGVLLAASVAVAQQGTRVGDFPDFVQSPVERETQPVGAGSQPPGSPQPLSESRDALRENPPPQPFSYPGTLRPLSESAQPLAPPSAQIAQPTTDPSGGPTPDQPIGGEVALASDVQRDAATNPDHSDNQLTIAAIEARRAELAETPSLSEELRNQIVEQYNRGIDRIKEAAHLAAQTESLRGELAAVAQETERLQAAAHASDPSGESSGDLARSSSDEIRAAKTAAETTLAENRTRLQGLVGEMERRSARLRELPELMSQVRQKLDEVTKLLAGPPPAGEPPEVTPARKVRQTLVRQFRIREIEFMQQEAQTYSETARLMSLRRDAADRAVKSAQRQLNVLQQALAARERLDAEQQAEQARRAAINAHPAVREAARINSELAQANSELVAALETLRNDLVTAEGKREDLASQYSDTRNRAEAARYSQAIGFMLRSQQAELPDTVYYYDRARRRQQDQGTLNLRLLEWENERRKILDTETVVDRNLQSVSGRLGMIETVDVRTELQTVFTARLNLYAELIGNARNQLSRLAALGAAEEDLARVIDEQSAFISEHILWVRSTAPLSPSLMSPMTTALVGLVSLDAWRSVWEYLKSDVRTHPIFELLIIPPVWLWLIRNRFRADLQSQAADAQRSSATGLTPTFHAITLTACLALPVPMLIALLGWRLTSIAPAGEFAYALGKASLLAAAGLLVIEFVRNACQKDGLGEAHFGWEPDATTAIRRAMRLAKISCLPASFVCLFTEFMGDELLISTVGRAALIIESLSVATIVFELLRGNGALAQMLKTQNQLTWVRYGYRMWATVLVAMPIVFAFVSAIGFHYTATQLSTRMASTWGVIALMVGLRALAMRWLLVVYRRLAARRSRERRAVIQARQLAGVDGAEAVVTPDTSLEMRLSDINDQAQRLIRISATVLGAVMLTVIWHEIMPALGYLNRFTFWENALLPVNEQGESPRVTLVDLIFGGTWMTVMVLACRNLPGLLDVSIFQRLPLDAGARYAASALTQYAMVVIGVAVCFRQVGIGWQSVQWLVAAMTVGLGFGLQEIFANFVSGIILLFERPIRVGDTVTIGNISGTVTRIRIRATTVLDWDNKELIVPNRDFVTGNLVNWTLSNPNLRLVIKVGIAYGSDTRLATRLLQEIGKSHPLTLPDPEPTVVFSSFGASSLDFELRVFASGLANFRILRHELHIAIDDSFRENGIEIAFPQQDLHVRSLPASWTEQLSGVAAKAAGTEAGTDAATYQERSEPKARKHVA